MDNGAKSIAVVAEEEKPRLAPHLVKRSEGAGHDTGREELIPDLPDRQRVHDDPATPLAGCIRAEKAAGMTAWLRRRAMELVKSGEGALINLFHRRVTPEQVPPDRTQ